MAPRHVSMRTPCGVSIVADRRTAVGAPDVRLARHADGIERRLGRHRGRASRRRARAASSRNPAWQAPACRASPQSITMRQGAAEGSVPSARTPKVQTQIAARQLCRRAEDVALRADGRGHVVAARHVGIRGAGPACQLRATAPDRRGRTSGDVPAWARPGRRRSPPGTRPSPRRSRQLCVPISGCVPPRERLDAQHLAHPGRRPWRGRAQ